MNVLLLAPLFPPAVGGAATYFSQLSQGLVNHADVGDVHVVAERSAEPTSDVGRLTVHRRLIPRFSLSPGMWRKAHVVAQSLQLYRLLPKLVMANDIDVVHVHSSHLAVGRHHADPIFRRMLADLPCTRIIDVRDQSPVGLDAAAFEGLLYCARSQETVLGPFLGSPHIVARYASVPVELPSLEGPPTKGLVPPRVDPFVCVVGDVSEAKGIPLIVEALDILRRDHGAPYSLVLVGPNRMGTELEAILSGRSFVHWLGPLPHVETLNVMRRAKVVAVPSVSEGMPRVALEALSLHKPLVVACEVLEFAEHCPEVLLNQRDPQALARKLLGANPVAYPIDEHAPSSVVSRVVSCYRDAVDIRMEGGPSCG